MKLVCDIEANGLLDTVDTIWCIVAKDLDTGQVHTFDIETGNISEGVKLLQSAETLVFHNGFGYDALAIKKLFNVDLQDKVEDTYILGQMCFPNDPLSGHSLRAWSRYFGDDAKVEQEQWEKWDPNMLTRCIADVEITEKLWLRCQGVMKDWDWSQAKELEYETYRVFTKNKDYWYLDVERCEYFMDHLGRLIEEYDKQLEELAPLRVTTKGKQIQPFLKSGELSANAKKYCQETGLSPETIIGPFSRMYVEKLNFGSHIQLKKWLLDEGWQPDTWSLKLAGQKRPKIMKARTRAQQQYWIQLWYLYQGMECELEDYGWCKITPRTRDSSYKGINKKLSQVLIARGQATHRLSVLSGWREAVGDTNRIPTFAYTCGTNTGRFKHRLVANVPKADDSVYFGKEMRSLLTVPEGDFVLVGADASQLEARVEGHYTSIFDKGAYAEFLLNTDIHQFNADSWGISRQEAKSVGYAMSYQCGPNKVRDLLGCTDQQAKIIHSKYREDRPAMMKVIKSLENVVQKRGFIETTETGYKRLALNKRPFIKGIDGRKLFIRSLHSLKNTLIQNAGMMAMKKAYIEADRSLTKAKIPYRLVMLYHDEIQAITKTQYQEQVGKILVDSIVKAGEYFKLNVPLAAEYQVGKNWAETH